MLRSTSCKLAIAVLFLLLPATEQARQRAAQSPTTSTKAASPSVLWQREAHSAPSRSSSAHQQDRGPAAAYAHLPMSFEQNVGQADGRVQFISRGKGYTLFLTPTEAVFTLRSAPHPLPNEKKSHERFALQNALREPRQTSVVRMKLLGVNSGTRAIGVEPALGAANYFIGRDPSKWHRGVPLYAKVQYSEVFPGIDLVYYGNQKQLEYDFVVKPGADPKSVSLGFDGTANSSLDASGNLALATGIGAMKLNKPVIYQMDHGQRKQIEGKYILRRPNSVGVDVPDYDKTKPLIIDPVLSYSTYLGGSGDDGVYDLAVDSQGNAYVTGWTDSSDFPVAGTPVTSAPHGTYVAFVAKLNSTGTALFYSTYLGGTGGDFGDGIALDASGYVYLTGDTSSADFPVTSNAYQTSLASGAAQNAYVSKLSPDGQSLLYSTYLGGGVSDGGYGIAVDANQNAYIAGLTMSGSPTPFPTTSNAFQTTLNSPNGNGFISRIDTTQSGSSSLVYSTYLGGSIAIANDWDQASAIAVDANQNVYVVGCASSPDFPVTSQTAYQTTVNPNGNAFLTRIDTTKSGSEGLIYSTIFGGTGSTDQASSVALDSAGKVYLTGGTGSGDFPTTTGVPNSGPGKVFVAKFDASKGSGGVSMMASRPAASSQTYSPFGSLLYSTLVGGSGGEFSYRVKVDPNGDAYISGWTWSNDFPVTPDAIQATLGAGGQNSFVAALSPDGTQELFGTYLGGAGGFGDFAPGLALDPNYNIYVAGATQSTDLQTTSGAFQSSFAGTYDAFVAKLTALSVPIISSLSPTSGLPGSSVTINGLNFGSDPGTSTVTFNGATAAPTSWSETQIIVPVPTDATTGNVVVTVNGLPSNGVFFALPSITGVAPPSGPVGARVAITGVGFGQATGSALIGNTPMLVLSWSDNQISAVVANGTTTGAVSVQQGSLTLTGPMFTITSTFPYQVSPSSLNMLVGETRTLSVKDSSGQPVTGLNWMTTAPSVVSLSTDDPPVLTALAPGLATVYAGEVPVSVTVYAGSSLPPGTPVWSVPLGSAGGPGTTFLVPAVPSDSGVDVFVYGDFAQISALSSDGRVLWTVPGGAMTSIIPGFSGDAFLKTPYHYNDPQQGDLSTHQILRRDPSTGQLTTLYTFALTPFSPMDAFSTQVIIPHPTGVLFVQDNATVKLFDPASGQQLASVPLQKNTITINTGEGTGTSSRDPGYGTMIVAGDGNAYLSYVYVDDTETFNASDPFYSAWPITTHVVSHLMLLRVSPDGTSANTELGSSTADGACFPWNDPPGLPPAANGHCTSNGPITHFSAGSVITNADAGVAVFANTVLGNCTDVYIESTTIVQESGCGENETKDHVLLTYVSNDAITSQINDALVFDSGDGGRPFSPALQREDGSYIGSRFNKIIAVGAAGGLLWQQPIGSAVQPFYGVTPLYATADGGVIATTTPPRCQPGDFSDYYGLFVCQLQSLGAVTSDIPAFGQLGTLYTLDKDGNITAQAPDTGAVVSWSGEWYAPSGAVVAELTPPLGLALDQASFSSVLGGNPTGNRVAIPQCPCLWQTTDDSSSSQQLPSETAPAVRSEAILATQATSQDALNCPICNLQPPSCATFAGNGPTYLILVGDPGTVGASGINHSVGDSFNLSAQQEVNDLQGGGGNVVACRVSLIQDFVKELTSNGFIDGGVSYFGHSGPYEYTFADGTKGTYSQLAVGQASGPDTNITSENVYALAAVRTAYTGPKGPQNILGPNASMWVNGCSAGATINDYLAGKTSIAQMISNQIGRGVYAWEVGMYFSQQDAAHDKHFDGTDPIIVNGQVQYVSRKLPRSLPFYMVPEGAPGHKPPATGFTPH